MTQIEEYIDIGPVNLGEMLQDFYYISHENNNNITRKILCYFDLCSGSNWNNFQEVITFTNAPQSTKWTQYVKFSKNFIIKSNFNYRIHFIKMKWWKKEHLSFKYFPSIFNLNNNRYIKLKYLSLVLEKKYPSQQENNTRFLSDELSVEIESKQSLIAESFIKICSTIVAEETSEFLCHLENKQNKIVCTPC